MNAVNGLRRLPAATSVTGLVALGQLHLRRATEVISAVVHFTLLVLLDVAHLLSLVTLDAFASSTTANDVSAKRTFEASGRTDSVDATKGCVPIARSVP